MKSSEGRSNRFETKLSFQVEYERQQCECIEFVSGYYLPIGESTSKPKLGAEITSGVFIPMDEVDERL